MTLPRPSLPQCARALLGAFNVVLWTAVVWGAAIALLGFPYRIGVDGQKARCLPWSVFLIDRRVPAQIEKGDLIQFRAGALGHGFDGLLFVKMVGATAGDEVEVRNDELRINGKPYDRLWLMRALKQAPGALDRRFVVKPGEYLMLGTTTDSYDGRYWGPIQQEQIVGSAHPLF